MAVPGLYEFLAQKKNAAAKQQQTETPKIDSDNVIGSLIGILGPSPEERAAEEERLQEHRRKMHGWTAVFNGLRHLSNLYYATKGAPGQKYNDPHAQIEQQYQDERKRLAEIHAADRNYYTNLWGLYRQLSDEQRRNIIADAQSQYYGTRDEAARQKAEIEKLKAVRVIKQNDGSLVKFDPVSGEIEPLSEADPLYQEWMRARINKENRIGTGGSGGGRNNGTYGYRTTKHIDPVTGDVITERVPTTGGQPQGKEQSTTTVTQPKKKSDGGRKKNKHVGW